MDRVRVDALSKNVDLTFAGEHGFQVLGNGEQLVVALGNLVENAVAYSPYSLLRSTDELFGLTPLAEAESPKVRSFASAFVASETAAGD